MKFVLALPLLLACILLTGQDLLVLHKVPVSDVYPLIKKRSKEVVYLFSINDGPMQPVGLNGEEIEPYLMQHEEAYALFLKYRKKAAGARTISTISTAVSIAGLASFFLLGDPDSDLNAGQFASLGVMTAGFAGYFWAGGKAKKSLRYFEESVRVYNAR